MASAHDPYHAPESPLPPPPSKAPLPTWRRWLRLVAWGVGLEGLIWALSLAVSFVLVHEPWELNILTREDYLLSHHVTWWTVGIALFAGYAWFLRGTPRPRAWQVTAVLAVSQLVEVLSSGAGLYDVRRLAIHILAAVLAAAATRLLEGRRARRARSQTQA